jgi:hypothetical protein
MSLLSPLYPISRVFVNSTFTGGCYLFFLTFPLEPFDFAAMMLLSYKVFEELTRGISIRDVRT